MKFEFKKPYVFEGKEYKEIEVDIDALTGDDMSAAKKEYAADGNFTLIPATDWDFCILVAARATQQPLEFFKRMPAKEYCKLATGVSNFLLA